MENNNTTTGNIASKDFYNEENIVSAPFIELADVTVASAAAALCGH